MWVAFKDVFVCVCTGILECLFFQLSQKLISAPILNVLFLIAHAGITRSDIVCAYYCRPASKKRKQMNTFESGGD